ncbi:MAG: sigma-70 family RNA polymerase sigma factor [Pseudomonadota bacterium]
MAGSEDHPGAATFVVERQDLIALACSIVGSPAVAEELVQDSWLRWQGRAYPEEQARPILRRIVVNLAHDWHRREKRERIGMRALSTTELTAETTALNTEDIVVTRNDLAVAIAALQELPERSLLAFRLHRMEGRTYEEIAARLGVSTSRAFQLVRAALVHVAKRIER